jgi:chorismate synthase
MPLLNATSHAPLYARADIDRLGTLRILLKPNLSPQDHEQAETDFVTSDDLTLPAYADMNDVVYNRLGTILSPPPSNWRECETGDLLFVRCPDPASAAAMATVIRDCKHAQDSIGGVVTCVIRNCPVGFGEPCFDKLQAMLAHAMLSLPAVKGFEIGSGFEGTKLRGSLHNDPFCKRQVSTHSSSSSSHAMKHRHTLGLVKNDAGGVLGGISSGADIYFKIAVKPVSTIGQAQETVDFDGNATVLEAKGRHDPCVLPRVPPLVEAMSALVLADMAMMQLAREHAM